MNAITTPVYPQGLQHYLNIFPIIYRHLGYFYIRKFEILFNLNHNLTIIMICAQNTDYKKF